MAAASRDRNEGLRAAGARIILDARPRVVDTQTVLRARLSAK